MALERHRQPRPRAAVLDRVALQLLSERLDRVRPVDLRRVRQAPITTARVEAQRAVDTIASPLRGPDVHRRDGPLDASSAGVGELHKRVPDRRRRCDLARSTSRSTYGCAHKIAPAVCRMSVVLKPASRAPAHALRIAGSSRARPFRQVDQRRDGGRVANHMVLHPDVAADHLPLDHPRSAGASGRRPSQAGEPGARQRPVIIEPGGDWEACDQIAVGSGFAYSGRTCVSLQRCTCAEASTGIRRRSGRPGTARLRVGPPSDPPPGSRPGRPGRNRIGSAAGSPRAAGIVPRSWSAGPQQARRAGPHPALTACARHGVPPGLRTRCRRRRLRQLRQRPSPGQRHRYGLRAAVFCDIGFPRRKAAGAYRLELPEGVMVNEIPVVAGGPAAAECATRVPVRR